MVVGLIKFREALGNTPSGPELRISGSALFHPLVMQVKVAFLRILSSKKIYRTYLTMY